MSSLQSIPTSLSESELFSLWDGAAMLCDVIGADGSLLWVNATEAAALGLERKALCNAPLSRIYTAASVERIRRLFAEPEGAQRLSLKMRRADRSLIEVAAAASWHGDGQGRRLLCLMKLELDSLARRMETTQRENEVLSSIVGAARDACWCIDFLEPVDLLAPEDEVLRQFFENECHWRYCNKAMADLYRLPEGLDFNQEPVRVSFPRNPENDDFVRVLIQSGFNVDGALSRDRRYDGVEFDVENDVRGHIKDGKLFRMWGTVRDLSPLARREQALRDEALAVRQVLSAAPDPILVVDGAGQIIGANPAVEWAFGWSVDEILGRPGDELLRPQPRLAAIIKAARVAAPQRIDAAFLTKGGALVLCDLSYTAVEAGDARFVIALRSGASAPRPRVRGKERRHG